MTSRWPPLEDSGQPRPLSSSPPRSDTTPTPPLEPGAIVADKYRIERVIGFGGMGIVCAAQHLELGVPVAVKFVRPERAADERASARFLSEARAAAQLQSQYACRVLDCGRLPTGSPYMVMEYLSGQDLRTGIDQRGPLAVEQAVQLMLQACEALAEAHAKHIVHRDVKPENLFVAEGPGGAPLLKVLDFGISKQLSPLVSQRSLTDSTESMGSPFHMSPEQMLDPSSVDSRTDIWSLGVVLYEILTGRLPFSGATAPQLCANVMTTEPIPPPVHRHDVPPALSRVVLRCLEKDKSKRYADVGELALALREFGGPTAVLAAARVEQILGRDGELQTAPPASGRRELADDGSRESREIIDSIPGVPRRGWGLRVSVAMALMLATGLAAWGVAKTAKQRAAEPSTSAAATAVALPEPSLAIPSPTPTLAASAHPIRKTKRPTTHPEPSATTPGATSTPTSAAEPAPEPAPDSTSTPAPAETDSAAAVYPKLAPLPQLDIPGPAAE